MVGYSRAFEGLYGPKPIEGKNKMNERIRELFESKVYPSFAGTIGTGLRRNERGEYLSDNLEDHWQTFQEATELIVRECIGCCEQVISDPVPESVDTWLNGGEQCIQEIKQHFGVEE